MFLCRCIETIKKKPICKVNLLYTWASLFNCNLKGQLQQTRGTGEPMQEKICAQPITNDRNVQFHGHKEELLHLGWCEELAFITQNAGEGRSGRSALTNDFQHIHFRGNTEIHRPGHAQTGNQKRPALGVKAWLQNQNPHPALFVIVRDLH